MPAQEISITRTHAPMKPRVCDDDLPFFRCEENGRVYLGLGDSQPAEVIKDVRSPLHLMPYRVFADEAMGMPCAEGGFSRIDMHDISGKEDESDLITYQFVGGFNNNAMEVWWQAPKGDELLWAALKTYTGIQVQYLTHGRRAPLMFAFAQDDAYAYCDYSPCKECVFRCKHGFVLYGYFRQGGLVRLACDRMEERYRK